MKRSECLKILAAHMDEHMLSTASLSENSRQWPALWNRGPSFYGLNMGMPIPFALGLSLAFPKRKVIAIESDGSLLLDTSSLVTLAEVNPPNLIAIVMDNQSYVAAKPPGMGPTATSRAADLEKIAQGAGIQHTRTLRTPEEFETVLKNALSEPGPSFFVAKVEPGREPGESDYGRTDGRPMKEFFVEALFRHPDYRPPYKLS